MSESTHYYTRAGEACHTQPTKPGAKNPTRPTALRDAIAQQLLPSASGIISVLSQPGLEQWKRRKVAESCFDRPPHPGEEKAGYATAVLEEGAREGREAADAGTVIHKALELHYTGIPLDPLATVTLASGLTVPLSDMVGPAIAKVGELGLRILHSEKVLVNPSEGYAGTTDIIFATDKPVGYGVLDFKTKKTKPGEKPFVSDTHPMQIAAYIQAHFNAHGAFADGATGYNLYISSTEVGRVDVQQYDAAWLKRDWEAFKHLLALWRWRNGYDPRF